MKVNVIIFPLSELEKIQQENFTTLPWNTRLFTYHGSWVLSEPSVRNAMVPGAMKIYTKPELRIYTNPHFVCACTDFLVFSGQYCNEPSGTLRHIEEHLIIIAEPTP